MDLLSLFAQSTELKFYETSWFAALTLFVFIFFSFLIGRLIAKGAQLPDHGWKIGLILFCIVFSSYYVATNWPPRFGVDLKGGVTFIVDLNLDNDPERAVANYMENDRDDDGKLSLEEFPADERRTFKRIDEDGDGFATREEIRAYAIRDAQESGQSQESVENVIDQLKKRIDPSGIYEVDLRALGEDQIEITIPDVDQSEANRIFERIKKAGYLQFRILAKLSEPRHTPVTNAAERQAQSANPDLRGREEVRGDGSGNPIVGRWVDVGRIDAKRARELGLEHRPFRYTLPYRSGDQLDVMIRNSATGEIISAIPQSPPPSAFIDEAAYQRFLQDPKLRSAFHAQWWADNQQVDNPSAEMQILVIEPTENENVEGQDLVPALVRQSVDQTGRPAVEFTLKREGVPKFSRLTGNNTNLPLGMVLDGELLSAPNIDSKIYKNGIIQGDFTSQEVQDLISILKAGQLKTTLQSPDGGGDLIDSTMGQEMKDKGFWAIGSSFVLILAFLVFYYRIAGIVSCLALILNLLMILAIIMMLKQPLTLNGLAGLVLTVGMSVDANVLIFERIREELSKEATLRMAIRNGFQRATTTIVDANITTFITAFILYVIGNEQLKSFSVALMLGIVLSMFTAIFCSRVMFDLFEKKRWLKSLGMAQMFTGTQVNFIGKRGIAFAFSSLFIVLGIAAVFFRGSTMLNHDLAGGSMARVVFAQSTDVQDIKAKADEIAEANPVNNAPAVISVAKVSSSLYPDGTYYRFVSNVKAGDGSRSFAELIKDGFGDQLAKQTVDVSDVNTTVKSKGASGNRPQTPQAPAQPKNEEGAIEEKKSEPPAEKSDDAPAAAGAENSDQPPVDPCTGEPLASFSELDDASLVSWQQENPQQGDEQPPAKQPSNESTATQDDPQAKQDPAVTPPNTAPSISQKTEPAEPATSNPGSAGSFPAGSGSVQEPPTTTGNQTFVTTAKIKFGLTVDGAVFKKRAASLKSDFVEAATSLQLDNYNRNNIRVRDAETGGKFVPDDLNYETDFWEVEITTLAADHGERILEAMKSRYNNEIFLPQSKEVGERFAQKAWLRAFAAMVASLIGIIAYIWIRFQRVSFGLAAVAALIHDVLVVVGAIAVSYWLKDFLGIILVEDFKISLTVIAALLTIIGYSLNDTIVVFDRIREVRGKNPELNSDMVNTSINQTLSRTVLTSLTTFIVVVILYGGGGDAIHGFAFALVVGVIVGTYSSIFVASPILLMLMKGKSDLEEA